MTTPDLLALVDQAHCEAQSHIGRSTRCDGPAATVQILLIKTAAALRACAEDRERLDWLEQNDGRFYNMDRISALHGVGFFVRGGTRTTNIREAIDAARRKP